MDSSPYDISANVVVGVTLEENERTNDEGEESKANRKLLEKGKNLWRREKEKERQGCQSSNRQRYKKEKNHMD